MTAEAQGIDAEAEEIGTDVIPASPPAALFKTDDPVQVIEEATRVADALKGVVAKQGLIAVIKGREHPLVEAWQTLGAMLGVYAVPAKDVRTLPWPNPVPEALKAQHGRGLEFGFEASYSAQRADGSVLGGGEARCVRTEGGWAPRDDFALGSMAQTRAISKALSGPLRFVMKLAGYDATPAEEMAAQAPPAAPSEPYGPAASKEQGGEMMKALGYLIGRDRDDLLVVDSAKRLREHFGGYFPEAAAWAVAFTADHIDRWSNTLPTDDAEPVKDGTTAEEIIAAESGAA